jgi:hypothetical protein
VGLTERHRNVLYQGLTRAVGDEEAVEAMLSQFPSGDDKIATERFVRTEIAGLEQKMVAGFADLKDHMHREMRQYLVQLLVWSYGAMFLLLAAVVTAAKILE